MRNRFLIHEDRRLFQKQKNKWVSFLQKAKKEYFSSLHVNKLADNKSFEKTQVVQCNQVYFSSSNVSTDTTVIVKD